MKASTQPVLEKGKEEATLKGKMCNVADAECSKQVPRVVCTCGLCICRKHHCQVHHVGTNTLMLDPRLQRHYDPISDYKSTFHPRQYQPVVRRGLAAPAQILPKAPRCSMDMLTVTHRDFVPKPVTMTQRCKEKNNLRTPRGAFQDITSYKIDFPTRDFDANAAPVDLLQSSLPRIVEIQPKENYLTTNKTHHKDWEGVHTSTPYKELQEDRFFKGDVQKETVSKVDFSEEAVKGGKPRTSCKNVAGMRHAPEGSFDGNTTSKMIYQLPVITEREPLRLRGRSEKNKETLEPVLGKMNAVTQYRSDNPGFYLHTSKRWMCPPYPDKLQLFEGAFCDRSEQKSSYRTLPEKVCPRMSFKVNGLATYPLEGGKFYDHTTNKVHFQRIPSKERFAEAQAVNNTAAKVSHVSKDGREMKETQHFGGEFRDQTTNQSEYFNFSQPPHRVRHGDNAERVFHPSRAKFNAKSITKTTFVPVKGERMEQCKPLDDRFHKEGAKYCTGFPNVSVYKVDFAPRPFPKCDRCPAEVILQEA